MANLYSLQVEKHALAGLMRNPEVFADVDRFVSDRDFYTDVHQTIFNCIKSIVLSNEKVDSVLLAQKIKNLGISFKADINIFDYIDSLNFVPVSPEATISAYQELVKFRAFRELSQNSDKIKNHIEKNINEPLEKVISDIDSIY
jgi:replicative DNA helicase